MYEGDSRGTDGREGIGVKKDAGSRTIKLSASYPYHRHGKSKNLRQAIRSIKGHDVFQMNRRKYV